MKTLNLIALSLALGVSVLAPSARAETGFALDVYNPTPLGYWVTTYDPTGRWQIQHSCVRQGDRSGFVVPGGIYDAPVKLRVQVTRDPNCGDAEVLCDTDMHAYAGNTYGVIFNNTTGKCYLDTLPK